MSKLISLKKLRFEAYRNLYLHRVARQNYLSAWEAWKKTNGGSTDSEIAFDQVPQHAGMMNNAEMYHRYATMYATMVGMELAWIQATEQVRERTAGV